MLPKCLQEVFWCINFWRVPQGVAHTPGISLMYLLLISIDFPIQRYKASFVLSQDCCTKTTSTFIFLMQIKRTCICLGNCNAMQMHAPIRVSNSLQNQGKDPWTKVQWGSSFFRAFSVCPNFTLEPVHTAVAKVVHTTFALPGHFELHWKLQNTKQTLGLSQNNRTQTPQQKAKAETCLTFE